MDWPLCWALLALLSLTAQDVLSQATGPGATANTDGSGCKLSEFQCENGRCVALNKYCDGTDDCGDTSDEAMGCTNCNRTFFGEIGSKNPIRIAEPFQRNLPFVCTMHFVAAGAEYGDIVELTFLNFQVGSLESDRNQSASCYNGHLALTEPTSSSPIVRTSQTRGFNQFLSAAGRQPVAAPLSSFYDGGELSEPEFGRFCGDLITTGGPVIFFSERNNVTLQVVIPNRASLHAYSFNLYLTYRFHPSRPSRTRYGDANDPIDLGLRTPGSFCDRTFDNCNRNKCKIRSPNFPGFYLRNFTCRFTIRHLSSPPGTQAQIVLSQKNEYKISIYTGRNSPGGASSQRTLTSDCLGDAVRIYDGATPRASVLSRFCGSGALSEIVSSGPEVTVELNSAGAQQLYASKLELDVEVRFVNVDEYRVESGGKCSFEIDGSRARRRGRIYTPNHTIPPNTTCSFHFKGRGIHDRVWLYFLSYFVEDKQRWSNVEKCDVASLEIVDVGAQALFQDSNSSMDLSVRRFCEKTSPRICARAAEFPQNIPLRPCRLPDDSYLSTGSDLIIRQKFYKSSDIPLRRSSFIARYEFVDTEQAGVDMGPHHGPCHRHFQSSTSKFGHFASPKNVFMYGRGGSENITCSYYFSGMASEKLRIYLTNLNLPTTQCSHFYDEATQRYTCRMISSRPNGPRISMIQVTDHWGETFTPMGCFCNTTSQLRKPILIESVGNNVTLSFTVQGMSALEDFNNFSFEASYEFRPATSCEGGTARSNGSEGELTFVAKDVNSQDTPLRCRWYIESSPKKYLYLKFQGHDGSRAAACNPMANKFVVYADGISDPVAIVCTDDDNINANGDAKSLTTDAFHASKEQQLLQQQRQLPPEQQFDLFSLSWYNESERTPRGVTRRNVDRVLVEAIAVKAGAFKVRWLEVTKPFLRTSSGLTLRNVNCLYECPELSACISPELWCDGTVHCPSGHDERPEHCQQFPVMYLAIALGSLLAVVVIATASVLLYCRRHKDRKTREIPTNDVQLEPPNS
ncbi:uncharacterized protein LOC100902960 [Galendromus occidentalis]|uniref:Uncharacterized protein LOC100902960 n=1 Tax=Galendromus occidentalis TaxID=34638 RepID=A0AAJ7SED5_9ACAR|nr:uncharacterized protein LOC100902960 [Galendromus occidentalis]